MSIDQQTDGWQSCPTSLLENENLLLNTFTKVYREIYQREFLGQEGVNHQLPIQIRAFRHIGDWRVFLVLTPWMLARHFVPKQPPEYAIPPDWQVQSRHRQSYQVLGPTYALDLLTGQQKAHLNYLNDIGHFFIHPLVLAMESYPDPEAVFSAWNDVIQTRDENLKQLKTRNAQHEEISRREFLGKLWRA